MRNGTCILLVPGSTRSGSTNVAALRAALDAAHDDVTAVLFEGLANLPAFNPDDDLKICFPPCTRETQRCRLR
jgi:chromate reductase, NAD(P)H dehydrogenase (quinone)